MPPSTTQPNEQIHTRVLSCAQAHIGSPWGQVDEDEIDDFIERFMCPPTQSPTLHPAHTHTFRTRVYHVQG